MEELSVNTSWDRDLTLLQQLTQSVLHTLEAGGPNLLTASDVLYLTQMIEMDLPALASPLAARVDAAEVMVSIATNYVKMASLILEPHMATKWMGLSEDGVSVWFIYLFAQEISKVYLICRVCFHFQIVFFSPPPKKKKTNTVYLGKYFGIAL